MRRIYHSHNIFILLVSIFALLISSASIASSDELDTNWVTASENADKILVFGDSDNGNERANAAATLESLGYQVTQEKGLPLSLSSYASIWNVAAYSGLSPDEVAALTEYSREGGSVYLTGERPCCEGLNRSVQSLLRNVLVNQNVTVGGKGDISGPFTFNPQAVKDISKRPNILLDFVPDSPGAVEGIGNIAARNVFASSSTTPVAGVWDEQDMSTGKGRVALMMDIDYLNNDRRTQILTNIATFLNGAGRCQPTGGNPAIMWDATDTPDNCSILPTAVPVRFAAHSPDSQLKMEVIQDSAKVSCSGLSGDFPDQTCTFYLDANSSEGKVVVRAYSEAVGESVLTFRLLPKNDIRNVPDSSPRNDNWWQFPDADGDGIPNKWEEDGLWVDGAYLNLPEMGADPNHKDIFVYLEAENGYALSAQVLDKVKDTFSKSPLSNPDGKTGVNIHFRRGEEKIPSSIADAFRPGNLTVDALQRAITYSGFGSKPEGGGGGVPQLFHWMINIKPDKNSSTIGKAYIKRPYGWTGAEDSLWESSSYQNMNNAAKDSVRATNFTHELGHQLGLLHKYSDADSENDPTYLSVMSYAYNTLGLDYKVIKKFWPWEFNHVEPGRIDFAHILDKKNVDWKMGKDDGKLTFVYGQYGESDKFYFRSLNNNIAPVDAEVSEDEQSASLSREAWTPSSYKAFGEEFGFEAPTDLFPSLEQPEKESVNAGDTIVIRLNGASSGSEPLMAQVSNSPQLGSVQVAGENITYTAYGNSAGEERLLVRVSNGTFGSDYRILVIDVTPSTSAGSSSTTGSIGSAGNLGDISNGSFGS